jgi:CheY-like chemotaxis protein
MPQTAMTRFRRRILIVDHDEKILKACSTALRRQSYEVLTARDGFEALKILRGAVPDLLIVELDLPRMSGFELLAVVRTRFPEVAVIATSNEYSVVTLPRGIIADAFVAKGPNANFELTETALGLIRRSPIRASRAKPDLAPVWVPRSTTQYIVVTCPECLRSFSIPQPGGDTSEPLNEECLFCGVDVHFWLGFNETKGAIRHESSAVRTKERVKRSKARISDSHVAIESSGVLMERRNGKG